MKHPFLTLCRPGPRACSPPATMRLPLLLLGEYQPLWGRGSGTGEAQPLPSPRVPPQALSELPDAEGCRGHSAGQRPLSIGKLVLNAGQGAASRGHWAVGAELWAGDTQFQNRRQGDQGACTPGLAPFTGICSVYLSAAHAGHSRVGGSDWLLPHTQPGPPTGQS